PQKPKPLRGLRDLVRTTNPTHYWLLVTMRLDNPQTGGPMRGVLVADDSSLTMGGLIVDMTPWLRLGLAAVAFSVLLWFPLLRGITRSIRSITDATRQIAEGRFDVRVASRRRDELGALAEAINQMAGRLDGLVKGQKRFLGDVAHELCSPLARLQMALGIIEQRAGENQMTYVKSAGEKAEQIATLVNELLVFSKASLAAPTVNLQRVNVKETVEEAARREAADNHEIRIETPGDIDVLADPELLARAMGNLLRNAIRYGAGGPITVSAASDGKTATISVADSGPGVPEEELPKIFDAFHRVDTSRTRETGGTGLGLTIVKSCVESCRGSLKAQNRQPHGLEVVVTLGVWAGAGNAIAEAKA
ncbi:MAG: HAMP domain-containing sensor histidine kinase, partial [Chthoniobacteraceae bacterium]